MPTANLQTFTDLTISLFPKGRAFRPKVNGVYYDFARTIGKGTLDVYNDIKGLQDQQIPDNPNFIEEDARRWEVQLGIFISEDKGLEERKAQILRKMQAPGQEKGRGSALYLQQQLQLAGFDLWVTENRFWDGANIIAIPPPPTYTEKLNVLMDDTLTFMDNDPITGTFLGGAVDGSAQKVVANSLYPDGTDAFYDVGDPENYAYSFFVGAENFPDKAQILKSRELTMRQIIMTIKEAHCVAFLGLDFI